MDDRLPPGMEEVCATARCPCAPALKGGLVIDVATLPTVFLQELEAEPVEDRPPLTAEAGGEAGGSNAVEDGAAAGIQEQVSVVLCNGLVLRATRVGLLREWLGRVIPTVLLLVVGISGCHPSE